MEEGLVRGTVDSPLKEFAKYFHQAQNCLWGYIIPILLLVTRECTKREQHINTILLILAPLTFLLCWIFSVALLRKAWNVDYSRELEEELEEVCGFKVAASIFEFVCAINFFWFAFLIYNDTDSTPKARMTREGNIFLSGMIFSAFYVFALIFHYISGRGLAEIIQLDEESNSGDPTEFDEEVREVPPVVAAP